MKKAALCILFLAIVGVLPWASAQEEVQFAPSSNGLYTDLKDQGCNPKWLSDVMFTNGIELKDLRHLPMLKVPLITINRATCVNEPPEDVVASTQKIVHEDVVQHSVQRGAPASVSQEAKVEVAVDSAVPVPREIATGELPALRVELQDARRLIQTLEDAARHVAEKQRLAAAAELALREVEQAKEARKTALVIVGATLVTTALVVGILFLTGWAKRLMAKKDWEAVEAIYKVERESSTVRIAALEKTNGALSRTLTSQQARIVELEALIPRSVIVLTIDGEKYSFDYDGTEVRTDGDGIDDFYLCSPAKHRLPVRRGDDFLPKLELHSRKCQLKMTPKLVAPPSASTAIHVAS